ncbi:uncharacterized protein LOC116352098 isoform X2 [Contarinia nasturtii]|uniref:uncharacterized protein LOC116352098 isoform X2 n=1 Tax=Contarinia nasturtii TaxID=265458 RepID=UPI0012D3DCD9|nr:uncharacterized protein LOC116352098 isoform X2 [Contarinia nasturtii]
MYETNSKGVRAITNFDMKDVIYYYFPELYTKCDKDDVQILYGGDIGINATGHFLCVFYKAENQTVYVYDSLYQKELHERQMEIINNRYPMRKYITFVEPKTKQIDNTSCGAFAIAYATTLIFGEDPYEYEMDFNGTNYSLNLRKHIRKMFECYELKHFPRNMKQTQTYTNMHFQRETDRGDL